MNLISLVVLYTKQRRLISSSALHIVFEKNISLVRESVLERKQSMLAGLVR
jgi:hypothetical protein